MELKHISLRADYGAYDDIFFISFFDNANFISNFISKQIRSYHIKTDGTYNAIAINITTNNCSCKIVSVKTLDVKLQFTMEEKSHYLRIKNEKERFEFYLSLLEAGYRLAETLKPIPRDILLSIHDEFRKNGYKNESLFKKKRLGEYGIKIELTHVLTSYSYNLVLSVYDLDGKLKGKNSIYETLPDEILFNKNVRHLVIDDKKLIVTDFLDHPQFVCDLNDLSKGIVKSVCVDENTKKYIPNENNKDEFERLKW